MTRREKSKFVLGNLLIVTLLVVTACQDQGDLKLQRKLAGTWTLEFTYPEGGDFKSVTRVSPKGFYISRIVNGTLTNELEGTWHIENGILVDTNTKHSNTNSPQLPRVVWRVKVVRLDEQEFVVTRDGTNDWGSPFERVTFRRTANSGQTGK